METIKYESILLEHNDKLRILLINSDTAGEVKKKMKNIKKYIFSGDLFFRIIKTTIYWKLRSHPERTG